MRNIPNKIYLQIGEDAELAVDYREFSRDDITWCEDRINDNDIEYVRSDMNVEEECPACLRKNKITLNYRCGTCGNEWAAGE